MASSKTTTDFCQTHQLNLNVNSSGYIKYIADVQEVVAKLAVKNAETKVKLKEIDEAVQQVRLTTNESESEISTVASLLEKLQKSIESEHIETVNQVNVYNSSASAEVKQRTAATEELSKELQRHTDANNILLENLKSSHMTYTGTMSANIEDIIKCLDAQHIAVNNRLAELQSEIKSLDLACNDVVQADANEIIERLQQEGQRIYTHENQCLSINMLMKQSLQEYSVELCRQVETCRKKNEHFHRNDLQTYKSTGKFRLYRFKIKY